MPNNNLYILTIQDNFTKYTLAKPLPNHQAGTSCSRWISQTICSKKTQNGTIG